MCPGRVIESFGERYTNGKGDSTRYSFSAFFSLVRLHVPAISNVWTLRVIEYLLCFSL